jgi:hypothetical protein
MFVISRRNPTQFAPPLIGLPPHAPSCETGAAAQRWAGGRNTDMLRQIRAKWHLVDPIFAANVSPMKCLNQTRTNVVNRLRIHQVLRAFFDSEARS